MPPNPICGNPLLLEFLEEWHKSAQDAGSKAETTYRKAATSMRNCPLPFDHPSESVCLRDIGPVIAKKLTERLIAWHDEAGLTPPPLVPYLKNTTAKQAPAAYTSQARKAVVDHDSDHEMDPVMLALLPEDVRADLLAASARYTISKPKQAARARKPAARSAHDSDNEMDPAMLALLPEDVRADLLAASARSTARKEKPAARARKQALSRYDSDNEMDPAMLALLPPKVRADLERACAQAKTAPKLRKRKSTGQADVVDDMGTDNSEEAAAGPAKKSRQARPKQYVPRPRTGGYAILRALTELDSKLTKEELIRAAQPYCDSSFTVGSNSGGAGMVNYTAWGSVKTLKEHNLITQKGRPARYDLTEQGREVGENIMRVENGEEAAPNIDMSDSTTASALRIGKTFSRTASATVNTISLDSDDEAGAMPSTISSMPRSSLQQAATIQNAPSKFDITTPFSPKYLKAGTFTVHLILDNREVAMKSDRDYLQRQLSEINCPHVTRPLELGDVMWVARGRLCDAKTGLETGEEVELSLDYVCERKRLDDLVGSIKDGRFHEQKFRLQKFVTNVTYIIEIPANGNAIAKQHAYMADAISTAIFSTQVVNNFFVKLSPRIDDTIRYLARFTRLLTSLFSNRDLYMIPESHVFPQSYLQLRSNLKCMQPDKEYFLSYASIGSLASKSKTMTLRDTFLKMLMCTKGVSAEKALEIQRCYKTPKMLIDAFKEIEGRGEEEGKRMVMWRVDPGARADRKKIKMALSAKIWEIWGKK